MPILADKRRKSAAETADDAVWSIPSMANRLRMMEAFLLDTKDAS